MWIGFILAVAFIIDVLLGDPSYRLHPVRLTGHIISAIEGLLRKTGPPTVGTGVVLLSITLGVVLAVYLGVRYLLGYVGLESLWDVYMVYSAIAFKDMFDHIEPIRDALEKEDVEEARKRTSLIVGRLTDGLGVEELSRAAVESLAEGFVDGLLTPVVWFLIGGGLGYLLGYDEAPMAVAFMITSRAVNTLDSMVGYRSPEYILLGRASARADDFINFLPARLSIPVLFVAATLLGYNGLRGIRVAARDRLKHPSPNAAHPESFIGGTLNIRLGGAALYSDGVHEKPVIGGNSPPQPRHIEDTKKITMLAGTISVVAAIVLCAGLY